jgi:signal transduction histidine kinase
MHFWVALLFGGAICSYPLFLVLKRPGHSVTRHVVAMAQMLMGVLLIHVTGGRIETHFHVFGSLALVAFYRDWRVLVTASLVVVIDHTMRGILWPQSVYGVLTASPWRILEHAGWVVFEDTFLMYSCMQARAEIWSISLQRAELEHKNAEITVARDQALSARSLAEDSVLQLAAEVQERKSAHERLAHVVKEVESANQELNDFAYVVSHDLKAPLRAIGSLAGWIVADYSDRLDDEGKQHLNLLLRRIKPCMS